jgi:hypothetical protein
MLLYDALRAEFSLASLSAAAEKYSRPLIGGVRISVRLYFIMSECLIDATSILHYELEASPV